MVVKYMHHRDDLVEHRTREASFGAQCTNHSANSMSSITTKKQCPSWPTVREVCSSPWPRKEFDWNGDVATRVDMRTTKIKLFKKYLCEAMSDPGKIIRPG